MIVFLQLAISVFEAVSMIALQLSRLSYFAFPDSTSIDARLVHPPKIFVPRFDTDFGMTLSGMVIEVSFSQSVNAPEPIVQTYSGIVTEASFLQPLKASF